MQIFFSRKSLEQKVFAYVCELGRLITRIILENYDDELAKERNKEAYRDKGKRAVGILFEEMDGVWLRTQDSSHKKAPKQEMKVFTMYEGWDAENPKRSRLVNKKMLAEMEGAGSKRLMIQMPSSNWTGSIFIKRSKRRSGMQKPRNRRK